MFPIYFNAASHLWIAYLFFFNGLLLHYLFRAYSENYKNLTVSFEAHFLAAFCLSISVNGLLLLSLDLLGLAFANATYILPILTVGLIAAIATMGKRLPSVVSCEFGFARILLYLVVFILLFYNGGLIEKIADSWWHMSLANKIGLENSFELSRGHLNGVSERYYPPLWHGNLALAKTLSGITIPVFWNSFTAWGAVLKVMAFFLFGYSLSKDKTIALLGVFLFVLLPGIGNSYLRVSAWPSHIAYTVWFVTFALCFALLDQLRQTSASFWQQSWFLFSRKWSVLLILIGLLLLLNFTHQTELVWFAVAMLGYLVGLSIYRAVCPQGIFSESGAAIISAVYRALLLGLSLACVWFVYSSFDNVSLSIDKRMAYCLPIVLLFLLMLIDVLKARKAVIFSIVGLLIAILALSFNYTHIASLFVPELALPGQRTHEMPLLATGWFSEQLSVPGWHLQLRQGLLYSGVVGLFLSLFMVMRYPSRMHIFIAANAVIALAFCSSPYLYQWLRDILAYHSPWRVVLLSFHPLIFASVIVALGRFVWLSSNTNVSRGVGATMLFALVALVVYDARPHFDAQLIQLKRQNHSAQRNWNVFYDQRYVYYDSMLRYQSDLARMSELVEPDVVVLADLPTSYYISATLPLYVRNIHYHQGFYKLPDWSKFLKSWHACTMHTPEGLSGVASFIQQERALSIKTKRVPFKYIVLNNDTSNRNLRGDCLWFRKHIIKENIGDFVELIFEGEYLSLYQLK